MASHHDYMQQALQLAEKGRYSVSPNPMVGCILVKNNQVVGQGFHQRAGEAHAEIIALDDAHENAIYSTMYVTLEPCAHHGKTPPCITAIIKHQIKKVYVACLDPNPLVAGKGIEALRAAGIEVEVGIFSDQAKKLNEIFFHYITSNRPFVIAKWAMSLDGQTITHHQDDREISCHQSQISSHELRKQVDAILIGAETARHDNPQLTIRHVSHDRQPLRIILSGKGNLPLNLKLFDCSTKTLLVTTDDFKIDKSKAFPENVEILALPKNAHGQIDLHALLNELGKREISSLLVEGGMRTHQQFIEKNLVNLFQVYLAPVIISNFEKKQKLIPLDFKVHDKDIQITACFPEKTNV